MIFDRHARAAIATCVAIGTVAAATACANVLGFESFSPVRDEAGTSAEGGPDATGDAPIDSAAEASTCPDDRSANSQHCGKCGHDCGGGKCEDSQCLPLALAEGLRSPQGLVVDDKDVFVAELGANRIVRFGKSALNTCDVPAKCLFTASNVAVPTAMGIDSTNVYWANASQSVSDIRFCPRAGCKAAPSTIVDLGSASFSPDFDTDPYLPLYLVVKDGQVFWPEHVKGAIRSRAVDGTGPITTYVEDASYGVVALAVDTDRIFFTDNRGGNNGIDVHAVRRQSPLTVSVVSTAPAPTYGIVLASTGMLFYTVPFQSAVGDGVVEATSKTADGGAPVGAFATNQFEPGALVADDANVYWVVAGDIKMATGSVAYCSLKNGCPAEGPNVLAGSQRLPRHITQDTTAIYWTNEGLTGIDGQVWKIAKP